MHSADLRPLPPRPNVENYKKQAKDFLKSFKAGSPDALLRAETWHRRHGAEFVLADAQLVIAREHGFESWPKFAAHVEHLRRTGSAVATFEAAADAIACGDATLLARQLRENPGLERERSSRAHRATLLHYVGANGVEQYRQKSPKNAVEIAALLLEAGAEPDALATIYGQSTTLGLVASSVHPLRAGVQNEMMQLLLDFGADIEGAGAGSPLLSALRNGRGEAAQYLAGRGACLDLEGAAGVGRLDVVKTCVESGEASPAHLESAFAWACQYGRTDVVAFLLARGMPIDALCHGQTGLHWTAIGAQLETLQFLLARQAPLDALNVYGGTPLGQAEWSAAHSDDPQRYDSIVEALRRARPFRPAETSADRPRQ